MVNKETVFQKFLREFGIDMFEYMKIVPNKKKWENLMTLWKTNKHHYKND